MCAANGLFYEYGMILWENLPQELNFNSDFSLKEFVVGNNSELLELDKRIGEINDMLRKVQSEKKQFQLLHHVLTRIVV